jgi:hypothetical protein|tara:strand:+ start:48 stop:731 length:684 start_codon:yes stop_codon:yes gene_type:complete
MAEDKYKVDKTKRPKPIQLKDATGPHELSDERNYEYLDKLFEMQQLDPLADLDSDNVYQLMDLNAPDITPMGQYVPSDYRSTYPEYLSGVEAYAEDYAKHGPRKFYEDPDKGPEREVMDTDVIAVYDDQWNSPKGLGILMHEARHRGVNDKASSDIIKDSAIEEEVFLRAMDTKYANPEIAEEARGYIAQYLIAAGAEPSAEAIDSIINYSNKLEELLVEEKLKSEK